jgi:hypothetical protein
VTDINPASIQLTGAISVDVSDINDAVLQQLGATSGVERR